MATALAERGILAGIFLRAAGAVPAVVVPASFKRIWVPFKVLASSRSFSSSPDSLPPGFTVPELY
jgi:hypothetical protein